MADSKSVAADKARQSAVDKRGYYTKSDQRYIKRTGTETDRKRFRDAAREEKARVATKRKTARGGGRK